MLICIFSGCCKTCLFVTIIAYLGDFRLVGGVLGCPTRILKHIPEDGVGYAGVVVTHTDVCPPLLDRFKLV